MPKGGKGYWTRKLEMDLVNFIRQREFIWKPVGNTNHHIQQKYKAYAEFASTLGRGFTASSVRDRWVNIRSTFNHNLRKVDRSKLTATSNADIYVPCWPLWKPLQFLREVQKKDNTQYSNYPDYEHLALKVKMKPILKMTLLLTSDKEQNAQTNLTKNRLRPVNVFS